MRSTGWSERSELHESLLTLRPDGRDFRRILIRQPRSRWASASSDHLRRSWKISSCHGNGRQSSEGRPGRSVGRRSGKIWTWVPKKVVHCRECPVKRKRRRWRVGKADKQEGRVQKHGLTCKLPLSQYSQTVQMLPSSTQAPKNFVRFWVVWLVMSLRSLSSFLIALLTLIECLDILLTTTTCNEEHAYSKSRIVQFRCHSLSASTLPWN